MEQLVPNNVPGDVSDLYGSVNEQLELDIDVEIIAIRDSYVSLDIKPRDRYQCTEEFCRNFYNLEEKIVKLLLKKGYGKYAILLSLLNMN